jgi:hypothetical protein
LRRPPPTPPDERSVSGGSGSANEVGYLRWEGPSLAVVFDAPASYLGGFRPLLSERARSISASPSASPATIERSASVRRYLFSPSSVGPTNTASADFPHPIPTSCNAGCTRQSEGSPRVKRVTFVPSTCRIYACTLRVILGFGSVGPLARVQSPLCASCSSGRHFAYSFLQTPPCDDALAVRLAVPITRACKGLSPPSHRPATTPSKRPLAEPRAMPGAPTQNAPAFARAFACPVRRKTTRPSSRP